MIFIANSKDVEGQTQSLEAELKRRALPFTWYDCATMDESIRRARQGQGPVVAVGGDSTVNAVITGLMMSGGQSPLGVLSTNASSDFCRAHHLPTEKSAALKTVLEAHTRPLDLAEACLTGGQAERAASYFSTGTALSVGGARGLAAWKHKTFTSYLALDDEKFEFHRTDYLVIFKNPILAQALGIPPTADGHDGRITLLLFHNNSKMQLAKLLSLLAARKPLPKPTVFARAFTLATLTNDNKFPVEYEGEAIGFTPMKVTLKSGALDLIAPPHS